MTHILKNKNLEVHIDLPSENYRFSRFDHSGKITTVKFQNTPMSGVERTDVRNENDYGKGFYNEFGIDTALGFEEAEIGGWFHKIGVGLIKKTDSEYLFHKAYEIDPAEFQTISQADNHLSIQCRSKSVNGYAYVLKKEITLQESSFTIAYYLENTGEKEIITEEYNHNFTAIDNDDIGTNYLLKFPFQIKPELFGETVNPEDKVEIGENEITFNATPKEQFFFSNLSGGAKVKAQWELINLKSKIGIRETANFTTDKINLWGWKHVISPELFYKIAVKPGRFASWSRTYELFKTH